MITIDEAAVEESCAAILTLLEESEVDPLEGIAACVDTINELARTVTSIDSDTVLDWAARRLE